MKNLFVYGTLKRGEKNSYLLDRIGGEWIEASIKGNLHEEGRGLNLDAQVLK